MDEEFLKKLKEKVKNAYLGKGDAFQGELQIDKNTWKIAAAKGIAFAYLLSKRKAVIYISLCRWRGKKYPPELRTFERRNNKAPDEIFSILKQPEMMKGQPTEKIMTAYRATRQQIEGLTKRWKIAAEWEKVIENYDNIFELANELKIAPGTATKYAYDMGLEKGMAVHYYVYSKPYKDIIVEHYPDKGKITDPAEYKEMQRAIVDAGGPKLSLTTLNLLACLFSPYKKWSKLINRKLRKVFGPDFKPDKEKIARFAKKYGVTEKAIEMRIWRLRKKKEEQEKG